MASLVRRGVLRNWTRFVRQGAVTSQTLNIQRLKLHENKAVRSLVTTSRLFAQESAPQLEASQDDPSEDEPKSNIIKTNQQLEQLDRQLYKLDMDVRRTGRTLPWELQKVVDQITPVCPCTSNQALMILRCCGTLLSDEKVDKRTERVEKYWKKLQQLGISLDVSHYNALLKVHLENGHKIIPSDFLSHMEDLRISPNRVTFQHMIGLYCLDGNITGATTILEHMKSQDMAINDSVFHYLLQGHCYNDDQASVDSTLEIMAASGLDLSPEAVRVMAVTHGKAGRWNKVQQVLDKAEEADVKLDDGDVFDIIVALCQAGLETEAKQLVEKLPKKRGYFQEMRSAVPQLIFTGAIDLAMEAFLSFKVAPTKIGSENHEETNRKDKGSFIVRSLLKAETDVDKLLKVVNQLQEGGYKDWHWLILEGAVEFGSLEYCEKIGAAVEEDTLVQSLDKRQLIPFIRRAIDNLGGNLKQNPEQALEVMKKIKALGFMIPKEIISNNLIPAIMDLDKETPGDVVHKINQAIPSLNFTFLFNAMMQSLLNAEKIENFRACSGFLLNSNISSLYADWWNASLARAYLVTDSLDDLINVLFVASRSWIQPKNSRERNDRAGFNEILFRSLSHMLTQAHRYRPNEEMEDILRPVVQELVTHRIGIPKENVKSLKEMVDNTELHQLLDKAADTFEEDYWKQDNFGKFMDERRRLVGAQRRGLSPGQADINIRGRRAKYEIPKDLQEMEKLKCALDERGEVNRGLNDALAQEYAKAGNPDRSIELINATENFSGSPMAINEIIENLVNAGKVDQAIDFYRNQREESNDMFSNTLIALCIGLAREGKHEAVLELLAEDNSSLLNSTSLANNLPLLEHYVAEEDTENLRKVFDAMGRVNLVKTSDSRVLGKLVQVHLVRGDLKAAVAEFERLCNEYRRLPSKFALMEKLIEEEEIEAMQKVLDLSIELVGEEKSLYDLAHNFLDGGKKAQAKKLFETPGLRYNEYKMNYLCEKMGDNKEALEDLVLLSKSIFGCDRNMLFTQLVKAYANDPDKVSEIWMNVQEEGIAPSDDLKIEIAAVLQAAGRSVPFEIPEKLSNANIPDDKPEKVKKSNVRNDRPEKERKTESKEKKSDPEYIALLDSVSKAAESGDIEGLLSILAGASRTHSFGLNPHALQSVIENGTLEDACKVADAVKDTPRKQMRKTMQNLFQKLKTENRTDLMTSLTEGFDEKNKKFYLAEESEKDNGGGEKVVNEEGRKKQDLANSDLKAQRKQEEAANLELKNSVIKVAKSGDMEGVFTILAANEDRYNLQPIALQNILENVSLEDACKVATLLIQKNPMRHREVKRAMNQLYEKLKNANRVDLMTLLDEELTKNKKSFLGVGVRSWINSAKAYNNPEEYLDMVRTSPNYQASISVPGHGLVAAMEKNSELGKGLNALVDEGSEMAAVLLSQVAMEKGDKEEFTKLWKLMTGSTEMSPNYTLRSRVLVNYEKLRWTTSILKELNAPTDAFKTVYTHYFNMTSPGRDISKTDDLVGEVLDNGVELKDLNMDFVKFLSRSKKSKFKDVALKAIAEEQQPSE